MKVLIILIFCFIEISHGFKYQYNSTFRNYEYTVPEVKMEDFEDYLFNQNTLDTYVGFIVDERWCRHGSRFVCYFNEVNHQFLTGPSYCMQKNWDNGTIDSKKKHSGWKPFKIQSQNLISDMRYINADNLQHRVALIAVDADFMDKHNVSIRTRSHIVWKLLKMSHLNFWILAFSTNFCPIEIGLSGNTVWPQASGFQKLAKMEHFWHL